MKILHVILLVLLVALGFSDLQETKHSEDTLLTGAKRRECSGMIHWLTINNNPSSPQSHPFPAFSTSKMINGCIKILGIYWVYIDIVIFIMIICNYPIYWIIMIT